MKKYNLFVLLLIVMVSTTSCGISTLGTLPYGRWENVEHGIVLDINPKINLASHLFPGTYERDGERMEISIVIATAHKGLSIYKLSNQAYLDEMYREDWMFGDYTFNKTQLRYTLRPHSQEKTGITDTIVFEKIKDYDIPETPPPKPSL